MTHYVPVACLRSSSSPSHAHLVKYSFAYPLRAAQIKTNHRTRRSTNNKTSAPRYGEPTESPPLSAVKIEEMLNKLSPGNLKKATSDFMKEWEKSLGEPVMPIKDKAC